MKVTVWNENLHEKEIPLVTELYPGGLHGYIAGFLKDADVEVRTATLDDPQCGLTLGDVEGLSVHLLAIQHEGLRDPLGDGLPHPPGGAGLPAF